MCEGEGEVESVRQGVQDALARPFELVVFVQEQEGGVVVVTGHVEGVAAHGLEPIYEQLRERGERFRFPDAEGHKPLVGVEGQPGQDGEAGLTLSAYGAEVAHPSRPLDQRHLEHSRGLALEAQADDEHRRGAPPRRRRRQRPRHFVADQRDQDVCGRRPERTDFEKDAECGMGILTLEASTFS